MLGRYQDFPTNIEGFARFTYPASNQTLQAAIIQVLYRLNKETLDMQTVTNTSPANCTLNFEFGVADADTFNYLDEEELEKIQKTLKQHPLLVLDVYCVASYHLTEADGKQRPLKFDHSMLRFAFGKKTMELFIYHERGTQRIPLEDMARFIRNQVNEHLTEKKQQTLILKKVIKSQTMFSLQ